MPKLNISVGSQAAEVEPGGGSSYDGPLPPKGIYRCVIKGLKMKTNKNKDYMISGPAEIDEPASSPKAKYNGYTIWFQLNVTKQGAGYVNNFLDALGFSRKAFWDSNVVVDDEAPPNITKIGTKRVTPNMVVKINAKVEPAKGGYEEKLAVNGSGFLPADAGSRPTTAAKSRPAPDDPFEDDEESNDEATPEEDAELDGEEEEEEEDDPEGEEEEDEDYDPKARKAELLQYERKDLRPLARELGVRVLKSDSDEALVDKIVAAELALPAELAAGEEAPF